MKISVEEFMKQEQGIGKKSRLDPYENAILTLKSNGYSYEQIMKFLLQNDIEISKTALHHFVKSRSAGKKTVEPTSPAKIQSLTETKPSRQIADISKQIPTEKQTESDENKTERPIIGKFDLTREINVEDLM